MLESVAETVTLAETAELLVAENAPLILSPGPLQASGSDTEAPSDNLLTVTLKLQLGPAFVEQVTVVVPTAKLEPEAGVQVTVPQVPTVVGAG